MKSRISRGYVKKMCDPSSDKLSSYCRNASSGQINYIGGQDLRISAVAEAISRKELWRYRVRNCGDISGRKTSERPAERRIGRGLNRENSKGCALCVREMRAEEYVPGAKGGRRSGGTGGVFVNPVHIPRKLIFSFAQCTHLISRSTERAP